MSQQYWVKVGQQVKGPFSASRIRQFASEGKLKASHLLSTDQKQWIAAARVKDLVITVDADGSAPAMGTIPQPSAPPPDQAATSSCPEGEIPAAAPLDVVSKYVPSGQCSHPVRLVLWFPLVLVAAIVGEILGAVVGAVICGVLAWVYTIVLSRILGQGIRAAAIVLGVTIGTWVGGFVGYILGIALSGMSASRAGQNRNPRVGFAYGLAAAGVLLILSGVCWYALPKIDRPPGWTFYLGIAFQTSAGLAAGAALAYAVESTFYCESCHSYATTTYTKTFADRFEDVRKLAHAGDVEALRALQGTSADKAESSASLGICSGGCHGFLELSRAVIVKRVPGPDEALPVIGGAIKAHRDSANGADKRKNEFRAIVSGVVDPIAVRHWKTILTGCNQQTTMTDSGEWYCQVEGTEYGPIRAEQLRKMARTGRLTPGRFVRKGSSGAWVPAIQIAGLFVGTEGGNTNK